MAYVEFVGTPGELRPARAGTAGQAKLSVRQLLMANPERAQEIAGKIDMPGVREMADEIAAQAGAGAASGARRGFSTSTGARVVGVGGFGGLRSGGAVLMGHQRAGGLSDVGRLVLSLSSLQL